MPKTPPYLIEIATRHQLYLERLKAQNVKAFGPFLVEMDRAIRMQLAGKELTEFTIPQLEAQIRAINAALTGTYADYQQVWLSQLEELAVYEAEFEAKAMKETILSKVQFTLPSDTQLLTAVMSSPLSVKGPDGGKLLEPFFKDVSEQAIKRVEGAIRLGYAQGQTTGDVLKVIRGTRAAGYQDGILANMNKGAEMLTRTALQHCAVQAREETWRANSDIVKKVRWVSTLDSRTTEICMSLDGQEFDVGEGPRPPIHIGCRSSVVGVLDSRLDFLSEGATRSARGESGKVSSAPSKQTYYEWLKGQPDAFQNDALGPTRAKLFREGGLSAERFRELQLGTNFQPLTLQEMRELEPHAFERAGL